MLCKYPYLWVYLNKSLKWEKYIEGPRAKSWACGVDLHIPCGPAWVLVTVFLAVLDFSLKNKYGSFFYLHIDRSCARASSVGFWGSWGSSSHMLNCLLRLYCLKKICKIVRCEKNQFTSTSSVCVLENLNKSGWMGLWKAWLDLMAQIHKRLDGMTHLLHVPYFPGGKFQPILTA